MRIGIQTRPWGAQQVKEHLNDVLAEVAAAGYEGVEIGAVLVDTSNPQGLRRKLEAHGLALVALHVGGEIYDPEWKPANFPNLEQVAACAAAAGAPYLAVSGYPPKPDKTVTDYRVEAATLNAIGELCRTQRLTLAYHNHSWEIENGCAELRFLRDHTDPALVRLALDVAWVQRAGASPVAVGREFLDRTAYFHLKDTKEGEWMEVGHGSVDFPGLFEIIRQRPFSWAVVEQDETRCTPLESARLSREYLRQHLDV